MSKNIVELTELINEEADIQKNTQYIYKENMFGRVSNNNKAFFILVSSDLNAEIFESFSALKEALVNI